MWNLAVHRQVRRTNEWWSGVAVRSRTANGVHGSSSTEEYRSMADGCGIRDRESCSNGRKSRDRRPTPLPGHRSERWNRFHSDTFHRRAAYFRGKSLKRENHTSLGSEKLVTNRRWSIVFHSEISLLLCFDLSRHREKAVHPPALHPTLVKQRPTLRR